MEHQHFPVYKSYFHVIPVWSWPPSQFFCLCLGPVLTLWESHGEKSWWHSAFSSAVLMSRNLKSFCTRNLYSIYTAVSLSVLIVRSISKLRSAQLLRTVRNYLMEKIDWHHPPLLCQNSRLFCRTCSTRWPSSRRTFSSFSQLLVLILRKHIPDISLLEMRWGTGDVKPYTSRNAYWLSYFPFFFFLFLNSGTLLSAEWLRGGNTSWKSPVSFSGINKDTGKAQK